MPATQRPYEIRLLKPWEFLRYQVNRFGLSHLFSLTDSHYPRVLRSAYCDHVYREIVICKGISNIKTLYHEIGHELGLQHSKDKDNVMYPYINRGSLGILEIDKMYYERYNWYWSHKLKPYIRELTK